MSHALRRVICFALLLALSVFAPLPAQAQTRPDHLTIGLLPGESAPTVMRLNEPLRAYLEKRLNVKVELVVGANYAATGEALRFGRLDVAYLGPVTYILRSRKRQTGALRAADPRERGADIQGGHHRPGGQSGEVPWRSEGARHRFRRPRLDIRNMGSALSIARSGSCFRARLCAARAGRP